MKGKRNSRLKKIHPKYRDMKTTNHKIKECYSMSLSRPASKTYLP